ncbi:unnamed protein product, partial [Polarella glacialis]
LTPTTRTSASIRAASFLPASSAPMGVALGTLRTATWRRAAMARPGHSASSTLRLVHGLGTRSENCCVFVVFVFVVVVVVVVFVVVVVLVVIVVVTVDAVVV